MSAVPVHACCVVVGDAGVLIRGPSGSGKSTLARRLLDEAARRGLFGRLVSDDNVLVEARGGRALGRVRPAIAGAIEIRGRGILHGEHEPSAVLRLVVDCGVNALDRMPEAGDLATVVEGVTLPRIVAGPDEADRVLLALGRGLFAPRNPERDTAL
ncbi:HPr kinase/phosphorylase [Alsobacter soli]|uniref:HPr kinase/phosphorylase n=1 Tax=Alsobacter soli TaxID=2109933 RepID=UPI00130490F4|nr:HPr kinase/phosphatase C-terminal domain-containing protein [Alsobacter soli]